MADQTSRKIVSSNPDRARGECNQSTLLTHIGITKLVADTKKTIADSKALMAECDRILARHS